MLLNVKQVKQYVKQNDKQISKEAIELLERKVSLILDSAINITGRFKRVRAFEIESVK